MADYLRPCPICNRPMDAQRSTCVFCEQAGYVAPPPSPAPPVISGPPPQQPAGTVSTAQGAGIFAVVIVVGILYGWLTYGSPQGASPVGVLLGNPSHRFEVRVSTSPPAAFTGSYMVVEPGGTSSSRSVEGSGAETYTAENASIVSAAMQKAGADGSLTVEIWRDGALFKTESTTAQYGMVTLAGN